MHVREKHGASRILFATLLSAAAAAVSSSNLIRWADEALHPVTKSEQLAEPFPCSEK